MQPQGHMQVVLSLVDDLLNPQDALDRPRFCINDGTPAGQIILEEGISPDVQSELGRMGHRVNFASGFERSIFGRGQIICRNANSSVLCGGSDPRADGCAMTL